MTDLMTEITRLAEEQTRYVLAHRERLLCAFLAETGCKPSECELVETFETTPTGSRVVVTVRKR